MCIAPCQTSLGCRDRIRRADEVRLAEVMLRIDVVHTDVLGDEWPKRALVGLVSAANVHESATRKP